MNRTSSSLSLLWTNGESGAGVPKIPRVVLGLAALALVAVAVFAVVTSFEAGVSQLSSAFFEADPAQWSALTAHYVPDCGAVGAVTNDLGRVAPNRDRLGGVGSELAVRGKIGLGRIESVHGQVSTASVGASATSYAGYAARGREGMLSSAQAVRGKIGLGRIDRLRGSVSAASDAASSTSYAAYAARGREGMLGSGLAIRGKIGLGRIDRLRGSMSAANVATSSTLYAGDTHYANDH